MRKTCWIVMLLLSSLLTFALADDTLPRLYTVQYWSVRAFLEVQPIPADLIAAVEDNSMTLEDGPHYSETRYILLDNTILDVNDQGFTWMCEGYDKYSQLLAYLRAENIPLDSAPLTVMNPEQVVDACTALLATMNIERLVVDEVQSLSLEQLEHYTQAMRRDWAGSKLEYFEAPTEADEMIRVTFRSELGGLKILGEPEAEFYVRADKVVYASVSRAVETIERTEEVSSPVTREEALQRFEASRGPMKSDQDDYEIISIEAGLAPGELEPGNRAVVRPCWEIQYRLTLHFGDQETSLPGTVRVSMVDGAVQDMR